MKTVLLSGGAGFIGSHLCDFLLDHNYRVICLDNLLTGRLANIRHHLRHRAFKFIKHDVVAPIKLAEKIDYVLHFASPASPRAYAKYPLETLKAGSLGTLNLLEIARQKRAVFVLASTSEVYGDPQISPQREEYFGNVNPVSPRSCYDEAKRFAEALTATYARCFRLDCRIIRIFNTYGPRLRHDDGRVIPNFINQARQGQPLSVYGRGQQTRSFCYISDLVEGIVALMLAPRRKLKHNLVFNLGNPEEFTISELARVMAGVLRKKLKIKYLPLPVDDPKQRRPDISKVRKLLGWKPKVDLAAGLAKII